MQYFKLHIFSAEEEREEMFTVYINFEETLFSKRSQAVRKRGGAQDWFLHSGGMGMFWNRRFDLSPLRSWWQIWWNFYLDLDKSRREAKRFLSEMVTTKRGCTDGWKLGFGFQEWEWCNSAENLQTGVQNESCSLWAQLEKPGRRSGDCSSAISCGSRIFTISLALRLGGDIRSFLLTFYVSRTIKFHQVTPEGSQ